MDGEKRPPDQQMQVTEIRIPARNQPISSLRCDYITQASKQVRNADRENNRYCNGNVVEQLHDQLASSIGKGTALSSNDLLGLITELRFYESMEWLGENAPLLRPKLAKTFIRGQGPCKAAFDSLPDLFPNFCIHVGVIRMLVGIEPKQ